jgi:hypothetical protein
LVGAVGDSDTAAEGAPFNPLLLATTVKRYESPFVSPVNAMGDAGAVTVRVFAEFVELVAVTV